MSKIVISWDVLNLMYDFEKAVASLATPMDDVIAKRTALRTYISELEAEIIKCHELQDSYCDRIAELEAERRWIPVSERLPENASNVLVLSRGEQLIGSYHSEYELWYVPFVDKPVITHWMPLPEPPEVR